MARKSSPTIVQEELPYASASASEGFDDPRMMDLDVEEVSPFLRGQKRVPARRGSVFRKNFSYLKWGTIAFVSLSAAALLASGLFEYGQHSWRFRIESSENIEVTGTQNVSKARVMEVMGGDIGRNIFFIPLDQQKLQLEQIPWVESASVMRFVPNRLHVEIHERVPVAFARVGPRIQLIDASGVLMELPPKRKYSFPVILGMNPGEPVSTRAPRMKTYAELMNELDAGGAQYSRDLSEVDLTDPEDTKVRVNDPNGDVLVELGSSNYAERYKTYLTHIQGWRQQFQKVESVDLRYDNQIIVNPDFQRPGHQPSGPAATVAAGVKPAAMITRVSASTKAQTKPAVLAHAKKTRKTAKLARPRMQAAKAKPANHAPTPQSKTPAAANAVQTLPVPAASHTAVAQSAVQKPSAGVAKTAASTNPSN